LGLLSIAFIFILCVFSYLAGSISAAIIVCKVLGYPDPRGMGSNNPGTTNVLRIAGKGPAILTLAGDVAKGVIPILIGKALGIEGFALGLMGLCAFMGHLFPIFFNFEGGKGVATAVGVITTINWHIGLVLIGIWLAMAVVFRYSSLAALVAAACAPILIYFLDNPLFYPALIMIIFLFYRHKANIKGLLEGTESKIGQKKEPEDEPDSANS